MELVTQENFQFLFISYKNSHFEDDSLSLTVSKATNKLEATEHKLCNSTSKNTTESMDTTISYIIAVNHYLILAIYDVVYLINKRTSKVEIDKTS